MTSRRVVVDPVPLRRATLITAMRNRGMRESRGAAWSQLIALAIVAAAAGCGSTPYASSKDAAPGMDTGTDAAASLWEMVVHPLHDIYRSISLGAPGTIYVVA